MSIEQAAFVALAGFLAGAINAVVGSGSLITFPTLLAIGLPPFTANVTNTVGIVSGSVSGVVGYRRELRPQLPRAVRASVPAILGSALGAALLLTLPQLVFAFVVPVLVAIAVLLVIFQPQLNARLAPTETRWAPRLLPFAIFLTAVYGGYFGAAQGVILMGTFTVLLLDPIQELNALKNLVAAEVNLVAALVFVFTSQVRWEVAAVLAVSSVLGGQAGALLGRRLRPSMLRWVIVAAGVVALVKLLV